MGGWIKQDLQDHLSLYPRMTSFCTLVAHGHPASPTFQATHVEKEVVKNLGLVEEYLLGFSDGCYPRRCDAGTLGRHIASV